MVFQKPNPFPAMSIRDNVLAGLKLTGTKAAEPSKDELVEECLTRAGLWNEVKDRLDAARRRAVRRPAAAAVHRPLARRASREVLLMDEPCSALDPTSTRRIEETIAELAQRGHDRDRHPQHAAGARVSDQCAFFLAAQGTPGRDRRARRHRARCSTTPRTSAPPTTSTAGSAERARAAPASVAASGALFLGLVVASGESPVARAASPSRCSRRRRVRGARGAPRPGRGPSSGLGA